MQTSLNVAKIVAVLAAQPLLIGGALVDGRNAFTCDSPGRCAIGELLHAAGVSDARLRQLDDAALCTALALPQAEVDVLANAYGLDRETIEDVIWANDFPWKILGLNV